MPPFVLYSGMRVCTTPPMLGAVRGLIGRNQKACAGCATNSESPKQGDERARSLAKLDIDLLLDSRNKVPGKYLAPGGGTAKCRGSQNTRPRYFGLLGKIAHAETERRGRYVARQHRRHTDEAPGIASCAQGAPKTLIHSRANDHRSWHTATFAILLRALISLGRAVSLTDS